MIAVVITTTTTIIINKNNDNNNNEDGAGIGDAACWEGRSFRGFSALSFGQDTRTGQVKAPTPATLGGGG